MEHNFFFSRQPRKDLFFSCFPLSPPQCISTVTLKRKRSELETWVQHCCRRACVNYFVSCNEKYSFIILLIFSDTTTSVLHVKKQKLLGVFDRFSKIIKTKTHIILVFKRTRGAIGSRHIFILSLFYDEANELGNSCRSF